MPAKALPATANTGPAIGPKIHKDTNLITGWNSKSAPSDIIKYTVLAPSADNAIMNVTISQRYL